MPKAHGGLVFPRVTPFHQQYFEATLPELVALGYGLGKLLSAMTAARLINYDLDPTVLCLDDNGRLVIVDFDNVFPILSPIPTPDELAAVRDIVLSRELPTKPDTPLPPEAREFVSQSDSIGVLVKIGEPFVAYALAALLLQMHDRPFLADSVLGVREDALLAHAQRHGYAPETAQQFAQLLREMLADDQDIRPPLTAVVSRCGECARQLAAQQPAAKNVIETLLGAIPEL